MTATYRSIATRFNIFVIFSFLSLSAAAQADTPADRKSANNSVQAEAILKNAVRYLGGDRYLKVSSQIGRGRFSIFKEGAVVSFQSFIDVIVFPDKERTEFRSGKIKTVQTNVGDSGWVFDGDQEKIKDQTPGQIEGFKKSTRVSLDNLLRGDWKNEAELSYIGKRPASLGKRNEVVRLTYNDGFWVEFEFASDTGVPMKALYKGTNSDGQESSEEDRYAQFVDISGIWTPFIIDRFSDGKPSSRINYESVEFNKTVDPSIFNKPTNVKDLKKDLKV